MRVVARGIRQAVEVGGTLDDRGEAAVVFPIDAERFFVNHVVEDGTGAARTTTRTTGRTEWEHTREAPPSRLQ